MHRRALGFTRFHVPVSSASLQREQHAPQPEATIAAACNGSPDTWPCALDVLLGGS